MNMCMHWHEREHYIYAVLFCNFKFFLISKSNQNNVMCKSISHVIASILADDIYIFFSQQTMKLLTMIINSFQHIEIARQTIKIFNFER